MAVGDKLLRSNITVLVAYPEAFANPLAPTTTELNKLFVFGTSESNMVFNISGAIVDDGFTANITDSDTDDTRTITDVGQVSNPTFTKYEVSFNLLRDQSVTANGVFNLTFDLFKDPDNPFYVYTRIGQTSTTAAAVNDDWSIFGVKTDYPIDMVDDGSLLKFGARFKNTGAVQPNYRLAA